MFSKRGKHQLPTVNWQFSSSRPVIFSKEGIKNLLKKLKEHKAAGPDEITTKLLKTLASELAPALELLYQATMKQGHIPNDWRHAKVAPIYKKGDRSFPENYRPVSLTSVLCKTAEHIVTSHIHQHLDKYNILTNAQHGFRKYRSTDTQLMLTLQDLHRVIEHKGQTDLIQLDFSKAFDKVPHDLLLHKLTFYGLETNTTKWISAFLSSRSQEVMVEGKSSLRAEVTSGVPQGSVLGPLLFLLFINDLPNYLQEESTVRLFADDAVLYRQINSDTDATLLQQDLDSLLQWENDWGMSFHPSKCQVMRITTKKAVRETSYNIRGHQLELVTSSKYLGVTISQDLTWREHINNITSKANGTLALLQRNISHCPKTLKAQSYKTLVRPQLEYCSPIWDPHHKKNIQKIEAVQNRAARYVNNDYSRHSSVTTMKESMGWESLEARRKICKVVFLYKIVNTLVDVRLDLRPSPHQPGKFTQLYCRTVGYQRSFVPDTIVIWNSLPATMTSAPTLEAFKAAASSVLCSRF